MAVSLLVIIVLAGGLYFLRPRGAEATEVAVTEPDESAFDPFEYVRSDQETPGLQESTESSRQVTLVVGDVQSQASTSTESPKHPAMLPRRGPCRPRRLRARGDPGSGDAGARSEEPPIPAPSPAAPAPSPAPRATGDFQYWIQVGSFSSRSRADDLHKQLGDLGYAGRIIAHDTDGVTMHRVRIGPYPSHPEADRLLGKLRSANEMDGWITQVRG